MTEAGVYHQISCRQLPETGMIINTKSHKHPNPDDPEANRCMMSSQKIEVGHTLKSKNAAAFLLFNPSGTGPRTSLPII